MALWYRLRVRPPRGHVSPRPVPDPPEPPGYVDPANVFRALWGTFRIRPMLAENNLRAPFLAFRVVKRSDEVRKVDRIPMLGTGKMGYKALRFMFPGPHYSVPRSPVNHVISRADTQQHNFDLRCRSR
jgi:hypothetical protein